MLTSCEVNAAFLHIIVAPGSDSSFYEHRIIVRWNTDPPLTLDMYSDSAPWKSIHRACWLQLYEDLTFSRSEAEYRNEVENKRNRRQVMLK